MGYGGVKRNLAPIDDLITRAVLFRLDSEQLAHRLAQAADNGPLKKRLAEHQAQQARLQEIIDLYSTGGLSFDEYRTAKTIAMARLEALGREIDRSAVHSPLRGLTLTTTPQEAWETHSLEWKRQLLNLLIDKIVVNPRPQTPGYRTPRSTGGNRPTVDNGRLEGMKQVRKMADRSRDGTQPDRMTVCQTSLNYDLGGIGGSRMVEERKFLARHRHTDARHACRGHYSRTHRHLFWRRIPARYSLLRNFRLHDNLIRRSDSNSGRDVSYTDQRSGQ